MANTACVPECKHRGRDKGAMIRCCLCATWFHEKCVNITTDADRGGIWPCPECRLISLRVVGLVETVNKLTGLVDVLTDKLHILESVRENETETLIRVYKKETETLTQRAEETTTSVAALTDKVDELTRKSTTGENIEHRTQRRDILVGSSLIKHVDENKLHETTVICKPGGKIADITAEIAKLPPKGHRMVTVVVGGNDCAARPAKPVDSIVNDYRTLIDTAISKAEQVTVGSICPRLTPDDVIETITAVNTELSLLCAAKGVIYVDHTPAFTLGDGTINDGYLAWDGVHLTHAALNKLASNLRLRTKDPAAGVCRQYQLTPIHQQRQQTNRRNTQRAYVECTPQPRLSIKEPAGAEVRCAVQPARRTQKPQRTQPAGQYDTAPSNRPERPRRWEGARDQAAKRRDEPQQQQQRRDDEGWTTTTRRAKGRPAQPPRYSFYREGDHDMDNYRHKREPQYRNYSGFVQKANL